MVRYSLFVLSTFLISGFVYAQGNNIPVIDKGSPADPADIPIGAEGHNPEDASTAFGKIASNIKTYREVQVEPELAKVRKDLADYSAAQAACRTREDRANYYCIEARNPDIQKYTMMAQALMAGVSGMTDSCSKFGKLMSLGNAALGLYQAQCGSWKGMCSSSCRAAVNAVTSARRNATLLGKSFATKATKAASLLVPPNPRIAALTAAATSVPAEIETFSKTYLDRELSVGTDYKAVAKKLETCNGYAVQLATSALGIVGMVKSMGEANNCEEDTDATATAGGPTPVDCTIAANKQNDMTCICQDAPRTPGCSTGLDSSMAAKSADSLRTASTSEYIPGKAGDSKIDLGGDGGNTSMASKGTDGGSSAPGAPMGGGSAGLGGGSGGGSGAGSHAAQKAAGLNTNILGGEGGGGGGGGGGWSSGGEDGLRQYLPGGAKDPSAGMAGQVPAAKEVTAPSGKSNWEKVRDRYRDNKPSLINY